MCLPFLKERAESFSGNIINNTPNGIIVLNEDLEVQQINRSAMNIMNIRNAGDVLGEPLIRILDPKDFLEVLNTAEAYTTNVLSGGIQAVCRRNYNIRPLVSCADVYYA